MQHYFPPGGYTSLTWERPVCLVKRDGGRRGPSLAPSGASWTERLWDFQQAGWQLWPSHYYWRCKLRRTPGGGTKEEFKSHFMRSYCDPFCKSYEDNPHFCEAVARLMNWPTEWSSIYFLLIVSALKLHSSYTACSAWFISSASNSFSQQVQRGIR